MVKKKRRMVEHQLKEQFDGDFSLKFNLAPPLFSKKDSKGHLVKAQYGSWMWQAFKLLAKCRTVRGSKERAQDGTTTDRRLSGNDPVAAR